jgi:thymidylate kinase
MTLIYILGTDGAGKTTVATRLAKEPIGGIQLNYVYCQLKPLLLRPLKWVTQRFFLRQTNQFKDYSKYQQVKRTLGQKRKWLTRIYCGVWYLDILLQIWVKLALAGLKGKPVIMDRYYLDSVVNIGVIQNSSPEEMLKAARMLEAFLPKAERCLFLNVSEAVAFARKNDIPSKEYLRERKERYLQIAPHYDFRQINADLPLDEVLAACRAEIQDHFARRKNMQSADAAA